MTRFTKTPLYKNKSKTMKKTYILLAFIITGLLTYSAYSFNENRELSASLETAIAPTELESLAEELELNRVSRIEKQKQINIIVESKKADAERADEIQKRIREITGL